MQRWLTDQLSGSESAARKVRKRFPDDEVIFATAVTVMKTEKETPVGWSWGRFFQRRANLVITNKRVYLESSTRSFFTLMWFAFIGYAGYQYFVLKDPSLLLFALVAFILLLQRLPFSRILAMEEIRKVNYGSVRGLSARCDILSLVLEDHTLQLVTSKKIPDSVRAQLPDSDSPSKSSLSNP